MLQRLVENGIIRNSRLNWLVSNAGTLHVVCKENNIKCIFIYYAPAPGWIPDKNSNLLWISKSKSTQTQTVSMIDCIKQPLPHPIQYVFLYFEWFTLSYTKENYMKR